jgi:hypothetical protein
MKPEDKSLSGKYSKSDLLFLAEALDTSTIDKIQGLQDDITFIEELIDRGSDRLFYKLMGLDKSVFTRVSPRFFFKVLLQKAIRQLEVQEYTSERSAGFSVPVFDSHRVREFMSDKAIQQYLTEMLTSFTRIESYTIIVTVKPGIRRKLRYNDFDIDSLTRLCEMADDSQKYRFYKRIADLCLFILGIFPEYTVFDMSHPNKKGKSLAVYDRWRRSADDYEREGLYYYRLAANQEEAQLFGLSEVFQKLGDNITLAKKPLNFISEHYLCFQKQDLFS